MPKRPTLAILGLCPHTYWAAAVVLGGSREAPRVVERRQIVFAAGLERSAYHYAAEGERARAQAWIDKVRIATEANAAREIGQLIADLQGSGVTVRTAATAAASARLPERLDDILGSHSRIHTAEGDFYRDVVAQACASAGLDVRREVEKELPALICDHLGIGRPELEARLKAMGAGIGPPWSVDQRLAAQAAWLCL